MITDLASDARSFVATGYRSHRGDFHPGQLEELAEGSGAFITSYEF